mmetsp:Transcript_3069/g.9085  ORF Transcript_3069/g.9085 Transcript_3069/m.9085 type:complete len:395 (+) Transcript_3069:60-1244(+)
MLPLACVLATVFAVLATVLALTKKLTARQRWSPREKTIVLTGASSGIGSSLARTYAAQGAKLYLVARRREALEAACEECMAAGASSAKAVVADVSSESGWDAIRSAIGDDTVDLLVLNAGLSMGSPFASLSERKEAMGIMKHLMDVNYMGAVGVLDACLGSMRQAEGGVRLLVVSSVVGLVAPPTRTGYAASKFALKGFFNALRVELGMSEQVPPTITLAYPGAVKTNINRARLRGGVDGGSGAVDLELDKSMSADRCASIMARAHAAGCRDVYYSIDGTRVGAVKTRLLRHLAFFFPAGSDRVLARAMRVGEMSSKKPARRQLMAVLRGAGRLVIAGQRWASDEVADVSGRLSERVSGRFSERVSGCFSISSSRGRRGSGGEPALPRAALGSR